MDQLSIGDSVHTILGHTETYYNFIPWIEMCNVCASPKFEWDKKTKLLLGYESPEETECTCDHSGKTCYIAVIVKARGKPIPKKPTETTYVVTIWDVTLPRRDECGPDMLFYTTPNYEFIIDVAVNPEDLDFSIKPLLIKYNNYLKDLNENNGPFSGKLSRANYIKDFKERMKAIIETEERPQKVSEENAHVTKRKKGHSHVRKN